MAARPTRSISAWTPLDSLNGLNPEHAGREALLVQRPERLFEVGVVGTPGGPAENPPRYGGAEGRAPIYAKGIRVFDVLDSREIVEKRTVPFPVDQLAYGRFRRRR